MITNPCVRCPDRKPGTKDSPSCHADCKLYLEFRQLRVEEREALAREKGSEALAVIVRSLNYVKKKHHKHGK